MNSETPKWKSPFGYTHPEKPLFTMCQSCKNEDTQRESLESGVATYSCYMCGAKWQFKVERK